MVSPTFCEGINTSTTPFTRFISVRPVIGFPRASSIVIVPLFTRSPVVLVVVTLMVTFPRLLSSISTLVMVGIACTSIFMICSSGSPSGSELFLALLER